MEAGQKRLTRGGHKELADVSFPPAANLRQSSEYISGGLLARTLAAVDI